jgi:hypothetical protein
MFMQERVTDGEPFIQLCMKARNFPDVTRITEKEFSIFNDDREYRFEYCFPNDDPHTMSVKFLKEIKREGCWFFPTK